MAHPCHGTDHGYVCHLAKLCRHVTPEATVGDAMLCTHLGFEHFMSHPMTPVGAISRARVEAKKRGVPEVVQALKREYERMLAPPLTPGAELQAAWQASNHQAATGQTMDLFA